MFGLAQDREIFLEGFGVLPAGLALQAPRILADPVKKTAHFLPPTGVLRRAAEEPVENELRVTLPRKGVTLVIIRNVTAPDLVDKEALGSQLQRPVSRVLPDPVGNDLVHRGRPAVLVVTGEKTTGGVAVGREAEVPHVVEDEQVVPMPGKRLHERGHPEVMLSASVDIPRGRMHPVRLEEGHKANRGFFLPGASRALCRPGLHEVQPWQGNQRPGRPSQELPPFDLPVFAHCDSGVSMIVSRKERLMTISTKRSFHVPLLSTILSVISSITG